jgi:hypothetical protein
MSSDYAGPRRLDDPTVMRAMAHPIRIKLLEQLTFRGAMTATQCAALVGESPSSCSFHLRILAKYGFIEEAEGGTGRQRPWQMVQFGNTWPTGPDTPVATRTAGEALSAVLRERGRQLFEEYLARQDEFGPEWAEAAIRDDFGGWLTPEELTEIAEQLRDLWMPYIARLAAGEPPRPGTRLVYMSAQAFPRADNLDEPVVPESDDDEGRSDA